MEEKVTRELTVKVNAEGLDEMNGKLERMRDLTREIGENLAALEGLLGGNGRGERR